MRDILFNNKAYQIVDTIQKIIHLLAHNQSDMTLAEHAPYLPLDLVLPHPHHDHERDQIVEHDCQQVILVQLEPLLLSGGKQVVALHHFRRTFVIIKVTLLINHYNKNKLANYF
jgi:hypothetical protein